MVIKRIERYRAQIIIVFLLLVIVVLYLSYPSPEKDEEPLEDEENYIIDVSIAPSLKKNGRWRVNFVIAITNLDDRQIDVLWNWVELTKIRFLGNDTIFEENIHGNFTEAKSLNPGDSALTLMSATELGFSEEPTGMWLDMKVKIKGYDIIEFSFHVYPDQVTSKGFKISTNR